MTTISADIIDILYNLKVDCIGSGRERHERPHKALLLLASLEILDREGNQPNSLIWSEDLTDLFLERFAVVKKKNDRNTPENPFHYLQTDGLWEPHVHATHNALSTRPRKKDFGSVAAKVVPIFLKNVQTKHQRSEIRNLLISRYFPEHRDELIKLSKLEPTSSWQQEESKPERSQAFKRKIAELYDDRCAACGLRIKLPLHKISFIDAAHLIPFANRYNDHPSNGIALCKHHHWAMDRKLIVPGPDLYWHVSNILDERRSIDEANLVNLQNKDILLPADEAFYPSETSLKWRHNSLLKK